MICKSGKWLPLKISELPLRHSTPINMPPRTFHFPYFPSPFSLLIFIREKIFPENCQVSSNQRSSASTMKKSGFFAASVAAASATAISAPSSSGFLCNSKIQLSRDVRIGPKFWCLPFSFSSFYLSFIWNSYLVSVNFRWLFLCLAAWKKKRGKFWVWRVKSSILSPRATV